MPDNATTNSTGPYTKGQVLKTKVDGQIVDAVFSHIYTNGTTGQQSPVLVYQGKEYVRQFTSLAKFNSELPVGSIERALPPQVRVASEPAVIPQDDPAYFNVNTRFMFITRMVDMVVRGEVSSLVVTGSGGLGKTHTIENQLKLNELGEDADYIVIKGHTTPKSLYTTLYHNRTGKIVVFDDCDSVLKNEQSTNLLKAVLDSYAVRRVSWLSSQNDEVPSNFEFESRVIFISNFSLTDLPQALISRALYVDVTMTPAEKIERIRAIAPALCPNMTDSEIEECVSLLDRLKSRASDLNLRTMQKVAAIRRSNPNHWQDMATYMVCARISNE